MSTPRRDKKDVTEVSPDRLLIEIYEKISNVERNLHDDMHKIELKLAQLVERVDHTIPQMIQNEIRKYDLESRANKKSNPRIQMPVFQQPQAADDDVQIHPMIQAANKPATTIVSAIIALAASIFALVQLFS
jgi:hypothetical protein